MDAASRTSSCFGAVNIPVTRQDYRPRDSPESDSPESDSPESDQRVTANRLALKVFRFARSHPLTASSAADERGLVAIVPAAPTLLSFGCACRTKAPHRTRERLGRSDR